MIGSLNKECRNACLMNDQLLNFLCLNIQDEAVTMVKNMEVEPGVAGVATRRKLKPDCQIFTSHRILTWRNTSNKPHGSKQVCRRGSRHRHVGRD